MDANSMKGADVLRWAFRSLQVNGDFTEAVVLLDDDSRLDFRHRVGERTVQATGIGGATLAGRLLGEIARFRLNGRHLDIVFNDGSCWEALFAGADR